MAKAEREKTLERGELLLAEWQVGDDVAALTAALGRDAAADLAVAERLGRIASVEAAVALQTLEDAADKLVRKEAKRSLYRLEQKGVAIPQAAAPAPVVVDVEPPLAGYLSAIDGNGDQLVWLTRSQGGVLLHAFAAINDRDGLRELELAETSRRGLRALRADLLERHGVRLLETDWRFCDFLVDRAFRTALAHGRSGGDYPGIRARLTREPVLDCSGYVRDLLDAEAVGADAALLAQSETLLKEPELRALLLRPDDVRPWIDAWLEVIDSPLVLGEEQQRERIEALASRAAAELFAGEVQANWVWRLEMLAYVFHATDRAAEARQALAAALALEKSATGATGVPVLEALTKACLAFYAQIELQRRAAAKQEEPQVTPE